MIFQEQSTRVEAKGISEIYRCSRCQHSREIWRPWNNEKEMGHVKHMTCFNCKRVTHHRKTA